MYFDDLLITITSLVKMLQDLSKAGMYRNHSLNFWLNKSVMLQS